MVDGLVVFDHLDQVLGLTWLMGACCLCVKELAIEMHLRGGGCSCIEKQGGHGILILEQSG